MFYSLFRIAFTVLDNFKEAQIYLKACRKKRS